ncbi:hypothetical protein [Agrobacterium pusense]|uniref:hypothetical protein n=1 Tax=Agrobacterium pusense TaxID=648995 RepID=UPI002449C08C|nr:hypothetical protein [Agrobacterium pusense]MDH0871784.1 hypothetical protein [Agrobacterium pusense]
MSVGEIDTALSKAALSAVEPVAWVYAPDLAKGSGGFGKEKGSVVMSLDGEWINVDTPLYAAPPAPSVAVKTLEWKGPTPETNGCHVAETIFGTYSAVNEDGWYVTLDDHPWGQGFEWSAPDMRMTFDDAAKAAQADYEARILSALYAQVQDVAEVSPVDYMRRHDAAIAAYEANTPNDYRYSALALRKAVDAAFAVAAAPVKQAGGE